MAMGVDKTLTLLWREATTTVAMIKAIRKACQRLQKHFFSCIDQVLRRFCVAWRDNEGGLER